MVTLRLIIQILKGKCIKFINSSEPSSANEEKQKKRKTKKDNSGYYNNEWKETTLYLTRR